MAGWLAGPRLLVHPERGTSGPAPGEIRLQWWADAITGEGHGTVRQNPLADALLQTIERYNLPTGTFARLIAARRFDLYDDPMPDLETFEGYAGETASALIQLASLVLAPAEAAQTAHAAGHGGVAQAIASRTTLSRLPVRLVWPSAQAERYSAGMR